MPIILSRKGGGTGGGGAPSGSAGGSLGGTYPSPTLNQGALPDALTGAPALLAWYKADALALADGAAVASWTDSSGNGRHAVQAVGANQPHYVASRPEFNNMPSVLFDGTADFLLKTVFAGPSTDTYSTFAVVRGGDGAGSSANGCIYDGRGTAFFTLQYEGTAWKLRAANPTTQVYASRNEKGAVVLLSGIYDGTSILEYVNGLLNARGAGTGNMTIDTLSVGCLDGGGAPSDFWQGDIAEVGIYSAALSAAQMRQLVRGLAYKYALPIAYPV